MPTSWSKPLCLVENSKEGGLQINEETLARMKEVQEQVIVVAIAGKYRTGKSYLMNLLAGEHGFELGSSIQAKTKGIWVWVRPHPKLAECCLVLLDTEGLASATEGSEDRDTEIFTLALLLSHCFTYNSMGVIDRDAIAKLHFISEMAEHVKVKAGGHVDDESEFVQVFPAFVWTLRDSYLEMVHDDGREISPDEYLEYALEQQTVNDDKDLKRLDTIPDGRIKPEFLEISQQYAKYVYNSVYPRSFAKGRINGSMLGEMAKYYVQAFNIGVKPCIQTAFESTAELENKRILKVCVRLYRKGMENINLPTDLDSLAEANQSLTDEQICYFKKNSVFDRDNHYLEKLKEKIPLVYRKFTEKNEVESRRLCQETLEELNRTVSARLATGDYVKSDGYEKYLADIDILSDKYITAVGHLPQANDEWGNFRVRQRSEEIFVRTAAEQARANDATMRKIQVLAAVVGGIWQIYRMARN